MRDIEFVSYNGEWPCLCSGTLVLSIDGVEHSFYSPLVSGGSVYFDEDYSDYVVTSGPWSVSFNDNCLDELITTNKRSAALIEYKFETKDFEFSKNEQKYITMLINENVPFGCCGGCA